MATDTTTTPLYIDFHRPILDDGEYEVIVNQTLAITGSSVQSTDIQQQSLTFHVEGPRFSIDPSLVQKIYPPQGGKGDYQSVMADLHLKRSTLPWERLADPKQDDKCGASWLFLLLIDENEEASIQEKNNIELSKVANFFSFDQVGNPAAPDLSRSPKYINYLLLDKTFATGIFPTTLNELQFLSYAHKNTLGEENAVLLCNRLPQSGKNSTVYLVSIENNYQSSTFHGLDAGNNQLIFPYLYKWKFHCFDDELFCVKDLIKTNSNYAAWLKACPTFSGLINDSMVYTTKESFEGALNALSGMTPKLLAQIESACQLPGTTFHEVLSNLAGGFGPFSLNSAANDIQATGSVKLNYFEILKTSNGEIPYLQKAWYRGPLMGINSLNNPFSTTGAASYDKFPKNSNALFLGVSSQNSNDASYASAFELGKLTALNDTDFCKEFYLWKNKVAAILRMRQIVAQGLTLNPLKLAISASDTVPPMPNHVLKKFGDWQNLIGIPYRYIIPNDELLPNESIRFFSVDAAWINAFIYGAFSIGKTVDADLSTYIVGNGGDIPSLLLQKPIQGFIVNSIAVAAWPDFEVDVAPSAVASTIQYDTNIKLYLCSGKINKMQFHLHPTKTHSGFLVENKQFKKLNGSVTATVNSNFTIAITDLTTQLQTQYNAGHLFDPAQVPTKQLNPLYPCDFANLMKEPTPEVIFTIN